MPIADLPENAGQVAARPADAFRMVHGRQQSGPRHAIRRGPARPICVPRGFRSVSTFLMSGMTELPCDVYVEVGGRAILYTTLGSEAAEVERRIWNHARVLIRLEDDDVFRRFLAGGLRRVLADDGVPPMERSRRAYAMTSEVVRPLFSSMAPIDREGLGVMHEAVDAVTDGLMAGDDLVWPIVATMQRHMTTHTHAINTAIYAVVLAQYLHVRGHKQVLDIGRGALLHDIGKTHIPATILDKPGPLSESEWGVMRGHPESGFRLVTRALGFVPGYGHIIAQHHERADGSGYPDKRYSREVASDSQLVAIADAFDALTSERSYKSASTPFEALCTMRFRMAGQFNDELLREFISLLGGWNRLRRGDLRALGGRPLGKVVS
jgi:putative nucleotidyltransferase with HDIG domain